MMYTSLSRKIIISWFFLLFFTFLCQQAFAAGETCDGLTSGGAAEYCKGLQSPRAACLASGGGASCNTLSDESDLNKCITAYNAKYTECSKSGSFMNQFQVTNNRVPALDILCRTPDTSIPKTSTLPLSVAGSISKETLCKSDAAGGYMGDIYFIKNADGSTTNKVANNAAVQILKEYLIANIEKVDETNKKSYTEFLTASNTLKPFTNQIASIKAYENASKLSREIEQQHINLSVLPGFTGNIWAFINMIIQIIAYTAGSLGVCLWIYESFLVIEGNDASITKYKQRIKNISIGLLLIFASYIIVIAITGIFYNL